MDLMGCAPFILCLRDSHFKTVYYLTEDVQNATKQSRLAASFYLAREYIKPVILADLERDNSLDLATITMMVMMWMLPLRLCLHLLPLLLLLLLLITSLLSLNLNLTLRLKG